MSLLKKLIYKMIWEKCRLTFYAVYFEVKYINQSICIKEL